MVPTVLQIVSTPKTSGPPLPRKESEAIGIPASPGSKLAGTIPRVDIVQRLGEYFLGVEGTGVDDKSIGCRDQRSDRPRLVDAATVRDVVQRQIPALIFVTRTGDTDLAALGLATRRPAGSFHGSYGAPVETQVFTIGLSPACT